MNADFAEEVDLQSSYTGFLSVGRDTKTELRALGLGTFDATVRELVHFYQSRNAE